MYDNKLKKCYALFNCHLSFFNRQRKLKNMKEMCNDEKKKRKLRKRRKEFEKQEKQEKKLPKRQRIIHHQEECQEEWMTLEA